VALASFQMTVLFQMTQCWFTNFVYNCDHICLNNSVLCWGIKIDKVLPLLEFLCITPIPKKPTPIFTVIVFTISGKTYNHRCQCKQMHQNYFRSITELSLNSCITSSPFTSNQLMP